MSLERCVAMRYEELTDCEQLVMKSIWDFDKEVSLPDILAHVNQKYKREWKPQTVSTFLARLVKKEYIKLHRHGRTFLYEVMISATDYKTDLIKQYIDFWDDGNFEFFVTELCSSVNSREEIQMLKEAVDRI